jgi:hypothetical protein
MVYLLSRLWDVCIGILSFASIWERDYDLVKRINGVLSDLIDILIVPLKFILIVITVFYDIIVSQYRALAKLFTKLSDSAVPHKYENRSWSVYLIENLNALIGCFNAKKPNFVLETAHSLSLLDFLNKKPQKETPTTYRSDSTPVNAAGILGLSDNRMPMQEKSEKENVSGGQDEPARLRQ